MLELNKIYNMDCVAGMKLLDDECIDLTVTSPPYDNLRTYNGFTWDFESVAKELYRITKQGGVVVWIVADATIKGSETGTSFRQALYFMDCGFNLHDTMIWNKPNPMPRDTRIKRYYQAFEYMFVFSKGIPSVCNHLRVPCKYAGEKRECYTRNADGTLRLDRKAKTQNHTVGDTKIKTNVWDCNTISRKDHPAPFPEQLANDHIVSWSNEGDTVFDPFLGSGTTGKMALINDRNFIGIELDDTYFDIAQKRIAEAQRR